MCKKREKGSKRCVVKGIERRKSERVRGRRE